MAKGRPKGSGNKEVDVVQADPTRCRKCGSTERSKYINPRVLAIAGIDAHGNRYARITWKRCQCLACHQWRDDVYREA